MVHHANPSIMWTVHPSTMTAKLKIFVLDRPLVRLKTNTMVQRPSPSMTWTANLEIPVRRPDGRMDRPRLWRPGSNIGIFLLKCKTCKLDLSFNFRFVYQ